MLLKGEPNGQVQGGALTIACDNIIIKPDGKLKMCGCTNSPIIGDIWNGIDNEWQKKMDDSKRFQDEMCFKSFSRK